MKKLLPYILCLLMALLSYQVSSAQSSGGKKSFSDETLDYVITYKWGLIHKEAGTARMSLKNKGSDYEITLTGKTKPWADKVYQVRDTLFSRVAKEGFKPQRYIKAAHEGGKYSLDDLKFTYGGSVVKGEVMKKREKDGKVKTSSSSMTASGTAYDMLSVFYFLRTIDYGALDKGKVITTSIFSGSNRETVKIRSLGVEDVKLRDGTKRKAYHIRFNFTSGNGKKSSDDIDAWLSYDSERIPLVIIGKLPIGSVRCYYVKSS